MLHSSPPPDALDVTHITVLPESARRHRPSLWTPVALFLTDSATIQISILLGFWLRSATAAWLPIELSRSVLLNLLAPALVVPVAYFSAGLHPGYGLSEPERLRRRTIVTATVFSLLIFWDYFAHGHDWSRGMLIFAFLFALILGPTFSRGAVNLLFRVGMWGKPVAIVGSGERVTEIVTRLRKNWRLGFVPAGIYSMNSIAQPRAFGRIADACGGSTGINTAIVVIPPSAHDLRFLTDLPFAQVVAVPSWTDVQSLWIAARDMAGTLGLEMSRGLLVRRNRILKSLLDRVLASICLLLTAPLIIGSAILVWSVDHGSPFFNQERRGRNGNVIRIWKIRTMYRDADARLRQHLKTHVSAAEEWNNFRKLQDDPRILGAVGRFLRTTSIDELPQLWNVLRGDMSMVGPRPFPDYHLEVFDDSFREFRTRVTPGMTGLWQVQGRSTVELHEQREMDRYYILNWSIWMDIDILARTLRAVLDRRGAC